jgi:ubiquinone/menaquinone biosynthesis C-methylase UbiE
MSRDVPNVAASFDARAASYSGNEWHQRCAERLVSLCQLQPGQAVLDAGTGTGFAALAAARAVGPNGRLCGVDVSTGMLAVARAAKVSPGVAAVEWEQGDATQLSGHAPAEFDVVLCAAALLYMPVSTALREWYRLLKPGGLVAFTTMRAGSPVAGQIFRNCAAEFGLSLRDPSADLGSEDACRSVLLRAGFTISRILSEAVDFSGQDRTLGWESNLRSAAHADALRLGAVDQSRLRVRYEAALAEEERQHPGALGRAEVLYAMGRS